MSIRKIPFAGSEYVLTESEDCKTRYSPVQVVPMELISGLSRLTYSDRELMQPVIDAMSPFQLLSKTWSSQICSTFLDDTDVGHSVERVIMPGSWFGQQSALMCRASRNYRSLQIALVDADAKAVEAATTLHSWDRYHNLLPVEFYTNDIFDASVHDRILQRGVPTKNLIVWNGLEHFDPQQVRDFLTSCDASICIQSTSMMAEDHSHTVNCIEDLEEYLPERSLQRPYYKGSIEGPEGTRYMVLTK